MQAFSIDDSPTTEIDDALSVQGLGSGTVVFGIHIAAPALAFAPDSPVDKVARERLSTVYMPGWKLTMLPDEVVQAYTLIEGRDCPAVRLYVTLDEATLEVRRSETRLERVPIAANLRHDQLDEVVTEASADRRGAGRLRVRRRTGLRLPPGAPPEGRSARWCAASPRTSTGPTTTSASTATAMSSPTAAST